MRTYRVWNYGWQGFVTVPGHHPQEELRALFAMDKREPVRIQGDLFEPVTVAQHYLAAGFPPEILAGLSEQEKRDPYFCQPLFFTPVAAQRDVATPEPQVAENAAPKSPANATVIGHVEGFIHLVQLDGDTTEGGRRAAMCGIEQQRRARLKQGNKYDIGTRVAVVRFSGELPSGDKWSHLIVAEHASRS